MMRISAGIFSLYDGLVALPWRPSYLAAMWILGGELQLLYESWISDEVPLMASTLDLVREVAIAGESPQAAARARELADSWDPVIEAQNDEAPAGLVNVFSVFQDLALEIAEPVCRYDSANWVGNAAENRWRDRNDPGPLDGQADDSSPMAQTFTLFRRIVSEVAAHKGPETDPVRIREQILGPR